MKNLPELLAGNKHLHMKKDKFNQSILNYLAWLFGRMLRATTDIAVDGHCGGGFSAATSSGGGSVAVAFCDFLVYSSFTLPAWTAATWLSESREGSVPRDGNFKVCTLGQC